VARRVRAANTPAEVIDVLEMALARVAADPDYRKDLEPTGTDIYYAPSKEFDQFVRSEIERFREIIRISGAKPD
jgi:tripartite-type tricarboxylate transporter receptor subunit TctC